MPFPRMPREKLLRYGSQALSDHELLAIFLRTGVPGQPVLRLSSTVLEHFNGINGVLKASFTEFCEHKGLGSAKYCQLQAAFELVKRSFNMQMAENKPFTCPALVKSFLLHNFKQTENERFACLFLNSKHHLLSFQYLFQGSISSTQVYPRTVAQYCLRLNASSVIFVHNHPSGDVQPSTADQVLTSHLIEVLKLIDVDVLDHFIIGLNKSFSMAEHGML
ncbi:DNA repair protein RadC [Marinicella sp. W31]|uniref:RadC family protein n=1 Tax=Marinicella sp. W31 TaxID=3023713 RepID=UPI003757B788